MSHKVGKLLLCPIINAMGPVIDPRHGDLLNTWDEVYQAVDTIFSEEYRSKYPDSLGDPAVFSWFVISWSGFKTNPVQRDFGYFNVYDRYTDRYSSKIKEFNDGIYWMYNHPSSSGVGNEWGMDWSQNTQYLEILMRFIAERNWLPSVVQVPTEALDTSYFLENYFPFDLSNRNATAIQWEAKNADGKTMAQVIDWRRAPHNWDIYTPSHTDYQTPGSMKRYIGRLLDIKSIVYVLEESEIEKAFQRCLEGHDVMLSAYEHDFRDRSNTIAEKLLEPVSRISKKYPEVVWTYQNSLSAFQIATKHTDKKEICFELTYDGHENILIKSSIDIFGQTPITFFKKNEEYYFTPPLRTGYRTWVLHKKSVVPGGVLHVAAHNRSGIPTISTSSTTL